MAARREEASGEDGEGGLNPSKMAARIEEPSTTDEVGPPSLHQ